MTEQAQSTPQGPEGPGRDEDPQRASGAMGEGGAWGGGEMRLMKMLLWSGALVAVIAIIAFALTRGVSHGMKLAPALPRQTLSGQRVTLHSLHGRPALVLFWASWCGGCRREANAVRAFAESSAGKGRIVGVDWGDHVKAAKEFLRRHRWSFPNLRDRSGQIGLSYGLSRLPALFVIDSHGQIQKAVAGAQSEQSLSSALAAVERP